MYIVGGPGSERGKIRALEYPCEILGFYGFYMAFSDLLARLESFYTEAR